MAAPSPYVMKYKKLGRTGLNVSCLSYGTWVTFGNQVDVQAAKVLLTKCREFGVNFFDIAEVYANGKAEEIMGQAIKELNWKRSDVVISTKIFWGGQGINDIGLSRKHIIEGTQASLRRLQMDYVDVLFCHRPDPGTPMEETVRAMNYVIGKGWAFYWGTSEWEGSQIVEAWAIADRLGLIGPAVEQPQYNLFARDKVEIEYAPLYKSCGLGLATCSALASGVLTGKYKHQLSLPKNSRFTLDNYKSMASRKLDPRILGKVDELRKIAEELKMTLAQMTIAWCLKNENISTVITGASNVEQIKENMESLLHLDKLTADVLEEIERAVESKPYRPEIFR
ncbi:hypothetical protein KP509_37G050900 [Ceratopteris richardii]|uniref:NADP-dependent oxidoreductase domain-containing protein n=1 Tax=Ceratopteris richardii TaxID=49495 RepID=A0A8T2Q935_CERRI|nr:hypothetical protein KP509_37G050900 [Ceratopteris richardii]KAH7280063.1 hypothetical protein KP509_37G050900 [Ceratopteris richardii]